MNISSKVLNGRWTWGGSSCVLVIAALQDFVAASTEIVKAGEYRRTTCSISGRDVTIPGIANIPPTTDSSEPEAAYKAWFEQAGAKRLDWHIGFMLNHVEAPTVAWEAIFSFNTSPGFRPDPPRAITWNEVVLLLSQVEGANLDNGIGVLAAGEAVTISSAVVANDSTIELIPKINSSITGELRAFNPVPGASFDVVSDNGADFGDFSWYIKS